MTSTTLEDAGKMPSHSHSRSRDACVEVYLFPCGHGDTILLRFPGDRWGLIDCHLPTDDGTRAAFFEFVATQGIGRLEWIVQTHPDFDHFHGMVEVLEYFTSEGRSVGYWCDSGLTVTEIKARIRWGHTSKTQYGRLQECLRRLDDQRLLTPIELNERVEPISMAGSQGTIDLYPIGPSARRKRKTAEIDLERLRNNPNMRPEANDISVVLVLSINAGGKDCTILLPGDAGAEALLEALNAWRERMAAPGAMHAFDVIKVPHHGSKESHASEICKAHRGTGSIRVAAVSAGDRDGLPDREVLREYLSHGWTVLATTTKTQDRHFDTPLLFTDRGPRRVSPGTRHLVKIRWESVGGLTSGPQDAVLNERDLAMYTTCTN